MLPCIYAREELPVHCSAAPTHIQYMYVCTYRCVPIHLPSYFCSYMCVSIKVFVLVRGVCLYASVTIRQLQMRRSNLSSHVFRRCTLVVCRSIRRLSSGDLSIFIRSPHLALYRNAEEHASPRQMHSKNNFFVFYGSLGFFLFPLHIHPTTFVVGCKKTNGGGEPTTMYRSLRIFALLPVTVRRMDAPPQVLVVMMVYVHHRLLVRARHRWV